MCHRKKKQKCTQAILQGELIHSVLVKEFGSNASLTMYTGHCKQNTAGKITDHMFQRQNNALIIF